MEKGNVGNHHLDNMCLGNPFLSIFRLYDANPKQRINEGKSLKVTEDLHGLNLPDLIIPASWSLPSFVLPLLGRERIHAK